MSANLKLKLSRYTVNILCHALQANEIVAEILSQT